MDNRKKKKEKKKRKIKFQLERFIVTNFWHF